MGIRAMALPFFALTLFVSAFLLFLVQPMIGKMILPRLGGTPQVWNTCMVFFQTALLAGYGYTHLVSTRMKTKAQLGLHLVMLVLPLLLLYGLGTFYARIQDFKPISGGNPIPMTLGLLTMLVGLPFLVVATSAPLLQKWFAHTGHPAAEDPYFLYGASNLGSFLSLLAYPFVIERVVGLQEQSWIWTVGYTVLAALIAVCAMMVVSGPPTVRMPGKREEKEVLQKEEPVEEKKEEPVETGVKAGAPAGSKAGSFKKGSKQKKKSFTKKGSTKKGSSLPSTPSSSMPSAPTVRRAEDDPRLKPVTPLRRLRWVALTAIPSSLMLGVTTYATTDLSPIPLLWLIPLMLYLISFVLVFARWPVVWVGTPHRVMVWIQPFAIAAMIMTMALGPYMQGSFIIPIVVNIFAFFITTMVCHGELAKDRPRTEYLTEFYLLMSVGGMLGGMFNALVAPVLFVYVIEYGLAIFVAGLLRPVMSETSWMDQFFEGLFSSGRGGRKSVDAENVPRILDYVLPIGVFAVFAIVTIVAGNGIISMLQSAMGRGGALPFLVFVFSTALLISLLFMERPIRYGLTIGAILAIYGLYSPEGAGSETIYADRSYFGVLRVKLQHQGKLPYTTLIHGHINHGMNFRRPTDKKLWGNSEYDFSRLATTYYHRLGPAGRVMELYNWFPGPSNTYWADARMPATLLGLGGLSGPAILPTDQLVALWSEPPYATIGLGTGTMASYARPFQHMHYYEIDNHIVRLSIPKSNGPYFQGTDEPLFTYLKSAKVDRGADIWILMGDARLRMDQPFSDKDDYSDWTTEVVNQYRDNAYKIMVVDGDVGGGPDNFYFMMVVDAFSSDAIPVHLITKEAIEMYFDKLTVQGILCVHTSNRYVNLVPVVGDVAKSVTLKKRDADGYFIKDAEDNYEYETIELAANRGHDSAPDEGLGHFTSEWVMVARKLEYLKRAYTKDNWIPDSELEGKEIMEAPPNYMDLLRDSYAKKGYDATNLAEEQYWQRAATSGRNPWTDDFSDLIAAIRW